MTRQFTVVVILAAVASLAGCSPEVGTPDWCKKLDEKPKGDWTANEASDFTKYCIFGTKK